MLFKLIEYSRKFTHVPPGLFSSSSPSIVRPVLLQDTTNIRPDHYLPNYIQKQQHSPQSRRVNQRQAINCYSYTKRVDNHDKENDYFYDDMKHPTWSEVISKDKSNQSYKVKPPINTQIIQNLFKTEENSSLENTDADTDSTYVATTPALKNMNSPKYITDSVYLMSSINNNVDFNNTSIERPYTVVRVSNVSFFSQYTFMLCNSYNIFIDPMGLGYRKHQENIPSKQIH